MNNLVQVNYNNEVVITTKMLAEVYECEEANISNNFKRNEDKFIEGKHYYKLQGKELKEFKTNHLNDDPSMLRINCLYLWTKRGASRHCKMLGTDKAWDMFDTLEENYFTQQQKPRLPQTYKEALQQLIIEIEEKEKLEEQNKLMQPKAQYFDNLVDRNLLTNFRDTAKELHIKQNVFINWLLENGYIYRDSKKKLKPYAQHIDSGLFELREYSTEKNSGVQTLITPKGKETLNYYSSNSIRGNV